MRTAALVGRNGSIDWLCLPRFDSPACFARLLGEEHNGYWRIAPVDDEVRVSRAYRADSLVLETTFSVEDGRVRVTDCMSVGRDHPRIVRIVEGLAGKVEMSMQLVVRFDYGNDIPWVRKVAGDTVFIAGPDAFVFRSTVPAQGEDFTTVANFRLGQGERAIFELVYHPSHEPRPEPVDLPKDVEETDAWWRVWSGRCTYRGEWRDLVVRSMLTLKALTFAPTGGIIAAPTTSLPEQLGGVRNWDYRYCWLRDATFALFALLSGGFVDEAKAWQRWLLRAVAGAPKNLQIVYGIAGERRIPEFELPWLAGYEGATPVRVGNAAANQFQLDVHGEVIDALFQSHVMGIPPPRSEWMMSSAVVEAVEERWLEPDRGLWEVRGGSQHFVYSKVMAWVALDRAVKSIERFGFEGPLDRWRAVRDEVRERILTFGFDAKRNTFTQYFGSAELDASCLRIPLVGFLPPSDPRVVGTIAAIERELMDRGFVFRYKQDTHYAVDGLPAGEGAFLACNFWLVDNYVLTGRLDDARKLFERILATANDVGLLAEEYEPVARRLVGNFPQAFSHVGLVNSALNLSQPGTRPPAGAP